VTRWQQNYNMVGWAYLKDIFNRLVHQPHEANLSQLLPDTWLASNPTHRWQIAAQRKAERQN
jgi:hypothetical protein